MEGWVLAMYVSCRGLDFMASEPKECVQRTTLSYASKQECENVIMERAVPYLGVPYADLICVRRSEERK